MFKKIIDSFFAFFMRRRFAMENSVLDMPANGLPAKVEIWDEGELEKTIYHYGSIVRMRWRNKIDRIELVSASDGTILQTGGIHYIYDFSYLDHEIFYRVHYQKKNSLALMMS